MRLGEVTELVEDIVIIARSVDLILSRRFLRGRASFELHRRIHDDVAVLCVLLGSSVVHS